MFGNLSGSCSTLGGHLFRVLGLKDLVFTGSFMGCKESFASWYSRLGFIVD